MNRFPFARLCCLCAAGLVLTLAAGCGALRPKATPQPSFYSLDSTPIDVPAATRVAAPLSQSAPTLIVNPPHAVAGFDSKRIIFAREAHKLEYFAHSEWVDTPARMLAPLILAAVENTGEFRAVMLTPSAAAGDLRLDTEIVRLQQEFDTQPSRVRLTLHAYLVDNRTRRVLAWREFDAIVPAHSEDPYGGVVAANRAVQTVLENVAAFCAETARDPRSMK
jgi:cholesterol transport system auxiliary component